MPYPAAAHRGPPSCGPAGASRSRTRRSGSCARPAGRCPSTGRCGPGSRCWRPAGAPTWSRDHAAAGAPARGGRGDPLLRHRGAARRGRGRPRHRGPASGRWSPSRCATLADVAAIRPLRRGRRSTSSTRRCGCWSGSSGETPLIGFAGAPFTLASLPGRGRAVAHPREDQGPDVRRARRCGTRCAPGWPRSRWSSCGCRSRAGVAAVQLFDSWAGALSEADYRRFVLPHSAAVLGGLAAEFPDLPRIHFGVGTGDGFIRERKARRRRPWW